MMHYHQFLVSRELGGAGFVAMRIAGELGRRRQASHLWAPDDGPAVREARRLGLDVRWFDLERATGSDRARAAVANLRLYRDLRPLRPGIAHIHSPFAYRALLPGLMLSGLRRVVHVHLEEPKDLACWAGRPLPDLIITCARSLIEPVRQTLPERQRERQWIEAVPNAVDVDRFSSSIDKGEAKSRVGAPAEAPLALMLANLAPHKGQETAIRAVAALKQGGIHLECWIAGVERGGDGAYTARLLALADELGVQDRVRLLGYRDDAPDLLRAADVFLLPSTHEGLPLSILEAQAARVPVLAAPTAGTPEVVTDGETGFLIPAGDARGYARRISDLLDDGDLCRRISGQAHAQAIREHNWRTYCDRLEALYRRLLRTGRWGRRPRGSRAEDPAPARIGTG